MLKSQQIGKVCYRANDPTPIFTMQILKNLIFYSASAMQRASMLAVFLVASTLFMGCGSGSDKPELRPVTGVVTVDGETVTAGQVTLIPKVDSGTRGPTFTGQIREDGSFSIFGPSGVEGVIPGEYQVVIYATPTSHEEMMKISEQEKKVLKKSDFVHDSNIPPVYQNPKKTPLKIVVKDKQDNSYQLQLTKQAGVELSRSIR